MGSPVNLPKYMIVVIASVSPTCIVQGRDDEMQMKYTEQEKAMQSNENADDHWLNPFTLSFQSTVMRKLLNKSQ